MRISVRVKTRSARRGVEASGAERLVVRVCAPPHDGLANEELREVLAGHFGVPKSAVAVVKGAKSKDKIVEVTGGRKS